MENTTPNNKRKGAKKMKTLQLQFYSEDSGFCKETFKNASSNRYYNRDTHSGDWYTATPTYLENNSLLEEVHIQIVRDGKIIAEGLSTKTNEWLITHDESVENETERIKKLFGLIDFSEWKDWIDIGYSKEKETYIENWRYSKNTLDKRQIEGFIVKTYRATYKLWEFKLEHQQTGRIYYEYRFLDVKTDCRGFYAGWKVQEVD